MARTNKKPLPRKAIIDSFDEHEAARPVAIRNPAGIEKKYLVGEIREGGVAWWIANVTERFKDDENDFDGMMEDLIEQCISTEEGNPVIRSTIDGWGDKCKQGLFRICKEVNGIDEEDAKRQGKK